MREQLKILLSGSIVAVSAFTGLLLTCNAVIDISGLVRSSSYGLYSPSEQNLERKIRSSQLTALMEQLTRLNQTTTGVRSRAGLAGPESWEGHWESMLEVTLDLLEHCQAADKQREETEAAWAEVADTVWSLRHDATAIRKNTCGR